MGRENKHGLVSAGKWKREIKNERKSENQKEIKKEKKPKKRKWKERKKEKKLKLEELTWRYWWLWPKLQQKKLLHTWNI